MNDLNDRALIDLPEARRFVYRNENDASRDDILTDAINDASDGIWDYCEREFKDTTNPDRSGVDGVGNATTTFTSATAAFTADDVGKRIRIDGAFFTIASFTNGTTVVLDRVLAVDTGLSWDFGELRLIPVTSSGYVDFRPFDLYEVASATLYADRADLDDTVLTTADYQLVRHGATAYDMHIAAPEFSPAHEGFLTMVSIRGWWGMPSVPGTIQLACKQWVKNIAENPGGYASSSMAGYDVIPEFDSVTTLLPAGMPAAVRYRLDDWARGDQPIR